MMIKYVWRVSGGYLACSLILLIFHPPNTRIPPVWLAEKVVHIQQEIYSRFSGFIKNELKSRTPIDLLRYGGPFAAPL